MTNVPLLKTWGVGELVDADMMNAQIRDTAQFALSPPWALVKRTGNQTIGNNSWTDVDFDDTADIDTDGMHDPDDGFVTITSKGLYAVQGQVIFDTSANDARGIAIDKIGATPPTIVRSGTSHNSAGAGVGVTIVEIEAALQCGRYLPLNVGDQIKLVVYQNTGGNLAALGSSSHFYTWLSVQWIRAWA